MAGHTDGPLPEAISVALAEAGYPLPRLGPDTGACAECTEDIPYSGPMTLHPDGRLTYTLGAIMDSVDRHHREEHA